MMDYAKLAQIARAASVVVSVSAVAASCRLTESLDGFTNGEGGASVGGMGGSAGAGGTTGGSGGTAGKGDADVPDGSGGDAHSEGGGAGGTNTGGTGGADAEPDAPSTTCASGVCSGSCQSCDTSNADCETDTNTSKQHCGECNHSCQGGACVGGLCQAFTLTSGLTIPWGIAADEGKVYWVAEGTNNNGTVSSLSVIGGQISTLAQGQSSPVYLVSDSQRLYWNTFASGGAIWRIEKSGTGQQQLCLANGPRGLAGDDTEVWWTTADGSIRHIAKAGGSLQIMATGLTDPRGIAVDATAGRVYWTSLSAGEILSANKDGSQQVTLSTGEDHPIAIAVNSQHVYWTSAGTYAAADCSAANGKLVRADKADGANRTELATGQACPLALWLDGDNVYWSNMGTVTTGVYNYDGAVMRWTGTEVEAFESGQIRPYGITTNSNSVFWTEQGIFQDSGTLKKRAK